MKKAKKIIFRFIIALLIVWSVLFGTDLWTTIQKLEKPIFAICVDGADDGGSGTYKGIGYSIEIQGNFMPEDDLKGIRKIKFYLFKKLIAAVVVD